jgi:proline iminopeptidase
MTAVSQGKYLRIDGYLVYTRTFPAAERRGTIVCVHGGPGATHDYLLPLTDLTGSGYDVVMYDALGCGMSELPERTDLFTMEHDLKVLEDVRTGLGLGRIHLMGSSYGGLLVLAYATRHSENLRSLISTGGLVDVPFASSEMARLKSELPPEVRSTLKKHEDLGQFEHPEYLGAVMEFYKRHLCRLEPWPYPVRFSLDTISKPVYNTMNGPNEFTIIGNIKDIDFSADLPRIGVPTLLVHGKYDEVTPAVGERIHAKVPGSRLVILENSSHLGFWEERERYLELVSGFLKKVDSEG